MSTRWGGDVPTAADMAKHHRWGKAAADREAPIYLAVCRALRMNPLRQMRKGKNRADR